MNSYTPANHHRNHPAANHPRPASPTPAAGHPAWISSSPALSPLPATYLEIRTPTATAHEFLPPQNRLSQTHRLSTADLPAPLPRNSLRSRLTTPKYTRTTRIPSDRPLSTYRSPRLQPAIPSPSTPRISDHSWPVAQYQTRTLPLTGPQASRKTALYNECAG